MHSPLWLLFLPTHQAHSPLLGSSFCLAAFLLPVSKPSSACILKYLFICLPVLVSVAACRIFRCCMRTLSFCLWDLVPQPGIELGSPELGAQSLSHWTSSEISSVYFRVRRTSFLTILTCTNCSPNSSCAFCLRPATSSSYRQPDLQNLRVCVTPGPEPGGNGSCFFCIITLPKCADLFKECSVQWVNWNNNPEGFFLISKNS